MTQAEIKAEEYRRIAEYSSMHALERRKLTIGHVEMGAAVYVNATTWYDIQKDIGECIVQAYKRGFNCGLVEQRRRTKAGK